MSKSKKTPDNPFARKTPSERQESAAVLMRECLADLGQTVNEAVVQAQAEKIVRSMCKAVGVKYARP